MAFATLVQKGRVYVLASLLGGQNGAIAIACVSSGLLFMARGSYMPYFFPLYQGLSGLDYARTAILLNIYLAANSIGSPFVGLLIDRVESKTATLFALLVNAFTLGLTLLVPSFVSLAVSVALLGATFTMGRVAFNKILISSSNETVLRRSVSIRAMLMTGGSFAGNVVAAILAKQDHMIFQIIIVYSVLAAAWLLSLRATPKSVAVTSFTKPPFWARLPEAIRNRSFMADLARLFVALLPYGCWGTIIPKFVFDKFQNPALIPMMYAFSTVTIVGLTYVFNQGLSAWFHNRGFPRPAWPYVAAVFFIGGLGAIAWASGPLLLCVGAVAFGLGEVIFTPCMDEAVKRNAEAEASGTYIGLVQLTEGGARLVGSAVSLTIYGLLQNTVFSFATWPVIISCFTLITLLSWIIVSIFYTRRK